MECLVALIALILPLELSALKPVLVWAYRDGAPGLLFPAVRLFSCLIVIFIPALALGATFPLAAHWFVRDPGQVGRAGGALYGANSTGAALGAVAAGFALIPAIGLSGTTLVGVTAGGLAVAGALLVTQMASRVETAHPEPFAGVSAAVDVKKRAERDRRRTGSVIGHRSTPAVVSRRGLAAVAVGLSGFAGLMYEIAWLRVFAMIVGPTTYAFAATVAAVIAGIAAGSAGGAWAAGRARRPAVWLALLLAATAIVATWASSLAGGFVPRLVAEDLVRSAAQGAGLLLQRSLLVAALILPAALGFGAAFPLALALVTGSEQPIAGRVGTIYAANTSAAVAGSLAAGFIAIPYFGLQHTLTIVSSLLVVDALIVILCAEPSFKARALGFILTLAAIVQMIAASPWDRDLLASGAYKYASSVPQGLDLDTALKAGTLLYYREGAASTVSVKRLTGTRSLVIDGKVDASSFGDMLTQKALAHLPLLLHPDPKEICIIGLGSGVTLGSALVHPISRADIVEISPEVVEAARYFADVNLNGLDDPRTHLIVGDGRSHLLLSSRKYDVIISEPSNPWVSGVSGLFIATGHYRSGIMLAPITARVMAEWILEGKPSIAADDFLPDRFVAGPRG